jgi:hypothetical protein
MSPFLSLPLIRSPILPKHKRIIGAGTKKWRLKDGKKH